MIEQRTLGKGGPSVACLGYGASDDTQAVETIRQADPRYVGEQLLHNRDRFAPVMAIGATLV